jgi:hypothetical protein
MSNPTGSRPGTPTPHKRLVDNLAQQLRVMATVSFQQRGPSNSAEWCCTYKLKQKDNSDPATVIEGTEWRSSQGDAKEQTAKTALRVLRSWDTRGWSVSSCSGASLLILE